MDDLGLVGDLAIVVVAAVIGGALARLLRLPAVIGYLVAGFAIGPHTPGPTGNVSDVQTIADLGVALLMFTLGIRFSLRELNANRRLAAVSGVLGTAVVAALGCTLGLALGVGVRPAILMGMTASISSTMLAMRMLEDKEMIEGEAGRLAIVISLVQDMTVVVMLVMIPLLGDKENDFLLDLGLALAKAMALLAGIGIAGSLVLPRILDRMASSKSRELFLLTVVAVALGTASLSSTAGLSVAFGAFLGGLLISGSPHAQRTLHDVLPLRDVFAVVFFVAIGMLIDPHSFTSRPDIVFGLAVLGISVKLIVIGVPGLGLGYSVRGVVPAAIALANMGEFSFVLVTQAIHEEMISVELHDAVLASVLVTMALSPIAFLGQESVVNWVERLWSIDPAPHEVPT